MRDVKDRFPYISIKRLKDIKNKLKKLIGTKDDAVLFDIIKPDTTTTITTTITTTTSNSKVVAGSLCNVATAPESGVLLLSRVVGFPFGGTENLRRKRPQGEQAIYKVLISNIKPELSIREKEFMNIKDDDTHVEWETGQMSWTINSKHFLVPIAKKYGNN